MQRGLWGLNVGNLKLSQIPYQVVQCEINFLYYLNLKWPTLSIKNQIFDCHIFSRRNIPSKQTSIQPNDSLWVRYCATHTGKGKKLSGSVFYWVIQKRFLRVQVVPHVDNICIRPTYSL